MCKPILDLTRPNGANVAPSLVGLTEPRPASGGQKAVQCWCDGANKFETQKPISLEPTEMYTYIYIIRIYCNNRLKKKKIKRQHFSWFWKKKKKHQTSLFCARSRLLYIPSFPLLSSLGSQVSPLTRWQTPHQVSDYKFMIFFFLSNRRNSLWLCVSLYRNPKHKVLLL